MKGSGPKGRIVVADLGLKPVVAPPLLAAAPVGASPASTYAPPAGVPLESAKLSGMRKTIAKRLDLRAIDGATGAEFMKAFREFVENPLSIVC